jgi:hypothetical protein
VSDAPEATPAAPSTSSTALDEMRSVIGSAYNIPEALHNRLVGTDLKSLAADAEALAALMTPAAPETPAPTAEEAAAAALAAAAPKDPSTMTQAELIAAVNAGEVPAPAGFGMHREQGNGVHTPEDIANLARQMGPRKFNEWLDQNPDALARISRKGR